MTVTVLDSPVFDSMDPGPAASESVSAVSISGESETWTSPLETVKS
jgi:hypothetical protein